MTISVKNGNITDISEEEKNAYVEYVKNKYPNDIIDEIILEFVKDADGNEDVLIETHKHAIPFNRIRRITGYLVGTLERFNDGKKAEEHDRVKHSVYDGSEGV